MSSVTVVPETAVTVKNLLYDNWDTSLTPNKDNFPETFVRNLVHFTTRYYATHPERIHNYQISVRPGNVKKSPEEVGALVIYKVEEELAIHVWAIAGIGDAFETVEQNLQTMLRQVDFILRNNAATQALSGIQFIRISPGTRPNDEVLHRRILHRIVTIAAVYYRTEAPSIEFSLSVVPASVILAAGNETTATVTCVVSLPPVPSVNLALSVSPVEPSIFPNWGMPPSINLGSTVGSSGTFSFAVTTKTTTPAGTYAIVVKGTSGTRSHTDTLVIVVQSNPTAHTFKYDDGTAYDTIGVYS